MKIFFILMTAFLMQASASTFAQKITLKERNSSLVNIFEKINQQSQIDFLVNIDLLSKSKPVNIDVKDEELASVLEKIFDGQPFAYVINDKMVVVTKKEYSFLDKVLSAFNALDVRGKVTDENGRSLPGATVKVKGTNKSVITNSNGEFVLNQIQTDAILVVSYLGYVTNEVKVNNQKTVSIVLKEEQTGLNEVVVVGYGEVSRKDLTGSVATIKSEAFENVPIISIDQMLQGKAPGLQVTSISGQPGDGTSIRIRGGNSLSASNEPLYVVDGIIAGDDFNPNLLNPEDIGSIDILKDASSTAIYGARGSNGVILITTKKGKAGKDKISVNTYTGFQELPKFIEMMNGPEYAQMVNDQLVSEGKAIFYKDVNTVPSTDWQKEVTRKAIQSNVSLQASGGDQRSNYLISGNYVNQEGIILNSGYRRFQFRANLNRKITPKLELSSTMNIGNSLTKSNPVSLGGLDYYSSALGVAPSMPIYKADGTFALKREYSSGNLNHPLAQAMLIKNPVNRNNLLGNVTLNWKPIEGLTIKSTFGSQLNFVKNNRYDSGQLPVAKNGNVGGIAKVSSSQEVMYLMENTVAYNKVFQKKHRFDALAGMTFQSANTEYLQASGSKYPTDVMEYNNLNATDQASFSIGSDLTDYAIVSYLGRINYGYDNRYLLTLTARADGSSRFATNKKYAFFPAVAVAWRAINEQFLKGNKYISNLKLRASYGKVGNQAIPSYGSLSTLGQARYIFGSNNNNTLGYIQGNYGNPNLRWETTGQYDLGLEVGLFKNRLNFEMDFYTKRTDDLLNNRQLPEQTGYSTLRTNIGSIRNSGIEFLVNSINIQNKKFFWSSSFNIATNKNKVVDLGGVDYILTQNISYAGNVSRLTLGDPVGTFWGATYYGTRKSLDVVPGAVGVTAIPRLGEALFVDTNKDGKLSVDDYGVIGDSNPKFFGGLSNNFRYKQFNLDLYMSFSYGNEIMNIADAFYGSADLLSNQYKVMVNRWSPSNPTSEIPAFSRVGYIPNTRWVYNGSYLRMKSLTFGYTLPGKSLKVNWLSNINVYVAASNLFVITNYPYYDPESNAYGKSSTVRGFDATNYPQSRTYTAGLKVNF